MRGRPRIETVPAGRRYWKWYEDVDLAPSLRIGDAPSSLRVVGDYVDECACATCGDMWRQWRSDPLVHQCDWSRANFDLVKSRRVYWVDHPMPSAAWDVLGYDLVLLVEVYEFLVAVGVRRGDQVVLTWDPRVELWTSRWALWSEPTRFVQLSGPRWLRQCLRLTTVQWPR